MKFGPLISIWSSASHIYSLLVYMEVWQIETHEIVHRHNYGFGHPVHEYVCMHTSPIHMNALLDSFLPLWILKLVFYINIWEFCSSFKAVMCLRYKYIYVVTYTVRCSNKSKQTEKKHKERDAVPRCIPVWALGLCHGWMPLPPWEGPG